MPNHQYSLALINHKVENSVIEQRASDGYINATAMCKAADRRIAKYLENDTTQDYLQELSSDVRIRTSAPDAPQPPAAQQNPVGYMRWKNGSAEYVSVKRWEVPFDGDWHTIYTTPQPTENLRCKSTQKRLAMLWGYVKQEPARQPLPADTYTALAHRIATKYAHRSDPAFCGYAFLPHTLEQFVRAIEQAHNITGGQ